MKRQILVIALLASLAGCASSGTEIDVSQVQSIQVGQTTKSDMVQMFGVPLSQSYNENGLLTMIWNYVHVGPFGYGTETQNLAAVFNDDGTVAKFNMIDSSAPAARLGD